jgi:hypothetical protein
VGNWESNIFKACTPMPHPQKRSCRLYHGSVNIHLHQIFKIIFLVCLLYLNPCKCNITLRNYVLLEANIEYFFSIDKNYSLTELLLNIFLIECHDHNKNAGNSVSALRTLCLFPPASSYSITITPKMLITHTALMIFNFNTQAYCIQHT